MPLWQIEILLLRVARSVYFIWGSDGEKIQSEVLHFFPLFTGNTRKMGFCERVWIAKSGRGISKEIYLLVGNASWNVAFFSLTILSPASILLRLKKRHRFILFIWCEQFICVGAAAFLFAWDDGGDGPAANTIYRIPYDFSIHRCIYWRIDSRRVQQIHQSCVCWYWKRITQYYKWFMCLCSAGALHLHTNVYRGVANKWVWCEFYTNQKSARMYAVFMCVSWSIF